MNIEPVVVYLHGLIHSEDDRIAFAAIARQLSVHPDKYLSASTPAILEVIGQTLRDGSSTKKYVFVLDEFDLFALRPKQTLFYCLLNLIQGRNVNIVLIGLTIRIDAADLLEKRVKSRFSQRIIVIPRPESTQEVRFITHNTSYVLHYWVTLLLKKF